MGVGVREAGKGASMGVDACGWRWRRGDSGSTRAKPVQLLWNAIVDAEGVLLRA